MSFGADRSAADENGLHLLVNSTVIKMLGEGEWKTKKRGADYYRQYLKVHFGTDSTTLAVERLK